MFKLNRKLLGLICIGLALATTTSHAGRLIRTVRGPEFYAAIPCARTLMLDVYDMNITATNVPDSDLTRIECRLDDAYSVATLASAVRFFNPDRTSMILSDLSRKHLDTELAPSRLRFKNYPELARGQGIPTSLLLNLWCLRYAGVQYAGLRRILSPNISNQLTLQQLNGQESIARHLRQNPDQPLPPELIATHFWSTNTGRYVQTLLDVTGLRVRELTVSDVRLLGNTLHGFAFEATLEPAPPAPKRWHDLVRSRLKHLSQNLFIFGRQLFDSLD